jgi:hypothetical protein
MNKVGKDFPDESVVVGSVVVEQVARRKWGDCRKKVRDLHTGVEGSCFEMRFSNSTVKQRKLGGLADERGCQRKEDVERAAPRR